jgi:hypothetical protein
MALTLAGTPAINGLTLPSDTFVSGMVLVNKTDFSAASSVSINNCFSAAYDNYKIIMSGSVSASSYIRTRMRASGVDVSTNYNYNGFYCNTSAVGFESGAASGAASATIIGRWIINYRCSLDGIIASPFLAQETNHIATSDNRDALYKFSSTHLTATSYDGITIYPDSGNFTGTVRVYGLRNS